MHDTATEQHGAAASIADVEADSMARGKVNGSTTGANLGLESKLWSMADSLRGQYTDEAESHLGLNSTGKAPEEGSMGNGKHVPYQPPA